MTRTLGQRKMRVWFPVGWEPSNSCPRGAERTDGVGAVRKLVFTLLLIALSIFVGYGLIVGDFLETLSNGAMICLTCIGVA